MKTPFRRPRSILILAALVASLFAPCGGLVPSAEAQVPRIDPSGIGPQKLKDFLKTGAFTRVLTVDATKGDFTTTALAYTYIGTQVHDSTHRWVLLVSPNIADTGSRSTYTTVIFRANVASTVAPCSDGQVQVYVAASNSWACDAVSSPAHYAASESAAGPATGVHKTTGDVTIAADAGAASITASGNLTAEIGGDASVDVTGGIDVSAGGDVTVAAGAGGTTGQTCSLAPTGSKICDGWSQESITLSTSGLTTDSSANLLPANSTIKSVTCEVLTSITTTTSWAVGDGTTAARFCSANSTLIATTQEVCLNHWKGGVSTDATGPTQASAAKLRITGAGSNPGAGVVRCTTYWQQTTPTTEPE